MDTTTSKSASPLLRSLLGILLLLPTCGLCTVNQFWLTVNTFMNSLTKSSFGLDGEFVGLENYTHLIEDRIFPASFGFTMLLLVVHILAAAILPPFLAVALNNFGAKSQRNFRLWFTLPLAYFGPALVMFGPTFVRNLWNPESLGRTYLLFDGLVVLAITCGVGLVVYLAVLRNRTGQEGKSPVASLAVTWVVTQLAVAAYALQSYNSLAAMVPGLGGKYTLGHMLTISIRNGQFGLGSAVSLVLFILVALLGIAAALIVILGRLQLKHTAGDGQTEPGKMSVPGWIAIVLGGLAVLFVTLLPLLMGLVKSLTTEGAAIDLERIFRIGANSILPAALTILFIQVPFAYLGAIGIGVLRPFGKASVWLLLPFAPWLFATTVPLGIAAIGWYIDLDLLGTSLSLLPPILLNIPMFFILTLFFLGQSQAWQTAIENGTPAMRALIQQIFIPSLPLALFMSAITLLAAMQEIFMPFMIAISPEYYTITVAILQLTGRLDLSGLSQIIILFGLPAFVSFFTVFVALQLTFFDRLIIARESA